jgi:hypothetical protein
MEEDTRIAVEPITTSNSSQAQIRLQLTTRHSDIALPENAGPILIPTSQDANLAFKASFTNYVGQVYIAMHYPHSSTIS